MTNVSMTTQSATASYGRPASIEEASNRLIIHPASEFIAAQAIRIGVSANVVSFLGLGFGLIAAAFYLGLPDRLSILAGFACMVVWHIFDGADGRVARATNTSSAFGRIIDGVCDHVVFTAVYVAITLALISDGASKLIWFLALAAGAAHAIQAAAYEERRQKFQRRSNGEDRAKKNSELLSVNGKQSIFAVGYDAVQRALAGGDTGLDQKLSQLRASGASADKVQAAVNRTAPIVRRWSILNANNRTIMIAVFALVGAPAYYFLYELLLLNIVLAALLVFEQAAERKIVADLEKVEAGV